MTGPAFYRAAAAAMLLCGTAAPSVAAASERAQRPTPAVAEAFEVEARSPAESLEGARYVAMGSSFAAGPLLPPAKSGAPVRCGQSMNNYPTLLAERFGTVLVDRTCSGARTDHVLGAWGDIPPQIDAVNEATRLVTVTIGGNDLNYIGNLFSATCLQRAREAGAAGGQVKPCRTLDVPTPADYQRVEAQLDEIARRVRLAAPRARLVFVQYLTPLPAKLCPATPVGEQDAALVRRIGVRLAEITGRVAQQNKALVVEMNRASATHTPCDPEPWMIGFPKGYDGKQGLQWHLNLTGMMATAESIANGLIASGVRQKAPQQTAPVDPATDKASGPVEKKSSDQTPVSGTPAARAP